MLAATKFFFAVRVNGDGERRYVEQGQDAKKPTALAVGKFADSRCVPGAKAELDE